MAQAVDPQAFRDCLALWASGVTVITARDDEGPLGITAASFSSLSLEPPLVLACIDHHALSHDRLVTADGYLVHVLARDQQHLSMRFATAGPEKWDGLDLPDGPFGAPVLSLGVARLTCSRYDALEGGDHTILLGRVEDVETSDAEPLVYWGRRYRSVAD